MTHNQITDYDEFNIYTTIEDIENYIQSLFVKGYESKDEIYSMCLEFFGHIYITTIDKIFNDED